MFRFYTTDKEELKTLIWSKSLTLLFGYFQQDNYKIEFLLRRLGTRSVEFSSWSVEFSSCDQTCFIYLKIS